MRLLKFYADWCSPCKEMSRRLEGFHDIEIDSINIESEENQQLIQKYNIRSVPCMLLLDNEDKELARFNGLISIDKLKEEIDKLKVNYDTERLE